ncbi:MAG TPA: winged helix DNA-binding domain-containing protein [Gaiellaceae bacterium]|nr:winged helix DNA-binding domain-containing protein [Gaiellaceae bacterium]
MEERVLTVRELNRATLARQHLLARTRLVPVALVEHLVGMQAQWPPSPYLGAWTRLEGFRRDALERALARGELLKATVMRQTLHLVSRRDYGLLRAAMSETGFPWDSGIAKRLAVPVRELAAAGPVTTADALAALAAHDLGGLTPVRAWRYARAAAHLVHHHEAALWHARPGGRFVLAGDPDVHDPTEARAEMLRRYLAAFGPSTRKDMTAWSMMHVPEIERALERLELRRFRDEQGRELLDVPDGPLPDAETPAPVRFLPKWDNVLLAWADRTRIVSDEHRAIVIAKNGDVAQTFLVDGRVAGTWRFAAGRVEVEPFAKLARADRDAVEAEAEELAAFLAD